MKPVEYMARENLTENRGKSRPHPCAARASREQRGRSGMRDAQKFAEFRETRFWRYTAVRVLF